MYCRARMCHRVRCAHSSHWREARLIALGGPVLLVETRVVNDALDHPALGATSLGLFTGVFT